MISQVFSSKQQSRGSIVAVNQTRSQIEGISGNKKHHLQMTSYKEHVLAREIYQVTNVQMVK